MTEAIRIHSPSGVFETGHMLSVIVEESPETSQTLTMQQIGHDNVILVPLNPMPAQHVLQGEVLINLPGTYKLSSGKNSIEVSIKQHRELGFMKQFGSFSVAVVIIVGGMLVWLKNRKALAPKQT